MKGVCCSAQITFPSFLADNLGYVPLIFMMATWKTSQNKFLTLLFVFTMGMYIYLQAQTNMCMYNVQRKNKTFDQYSPNMNLKL